MSAEDGSCARPEFVDAHHHLWDLERNPRYPWLLKPVQPSHMGDYSAIQCSYSIDEYRRDVSHLKLVGSVHIEAGWTRLDPVGETRWLQGLSIAEGLPTAVVAFADLSLDDPVPILEAHAESRAVRGMRCMSTRDGESVYDLRPGTSRIASDRFLANLPLLERYGFSFDLQATPAIFKDAAALADRARDVPIALTHLGLPLWRDCDALTSWRQGLAELAKRTNVYIKISGLAMIDPLWTAKSVGEIIDIALELFGPARCMLGTNFPVDKLGADPVVLLRACLAGLDLLAGHERQEVLSGTARRFYRLAC